MFQYEMGSATTAALVASNSARNADCKSCDFTIRITILSTILGVFGLAILLVTITCLCKIYRIRRRGSTLGVQMVLPKKDEIDETKLNELDSRIGAFLDENPAVWDMSDHKIPAYLQEHVTGLSDADAKLALELVARRRLTLVIQK